MQQRCEECGKMISYEREMKSIACAYCYTEYRVNPDGRLVAAGDDDPLAPAPSQDSDYADAERRERTRLNRLMEEGTDQHLTFLRETQAGGGPGGPGGPRVGTVMPAPGEVGMAGAPPGGGLQGQGPQPVIQPPKSMEELEFNPMTGEVQRPPMVRRQQTGQRPQGQPAKSAPMAQNAETRPPQQPKDEIKFATFDAGGGTSGSRKQLLIIVGAVAVLGVAVAAAMMVVGSGSDDDNRGGFTLTPPPNDDGANGGNDQIGTNGDGGNGSTGPTVSLKSALDDVETQLATCEIEAVANAIAALDQITSYLESASATAADRERLDSLRPIASKLMDRLYVLELAKQHIDHLEAGSPDDEVAARYDRLWSEHHLGSLTSSTPGDRPWDREVARRAQALQARLDSAIAQYPTETW